MKLTCVVLFTSLITASAQTPTVRPSHHAARPHAPAKLKSDPNQAKDDTPVGTVVAFAGPDNLIPDGWLICNGATVARSNFPELFNLIQGYWGPYDPIGGIFTLPDLRGIFLRGVNGTRNDAFADPEVDKRLPKPEKGKNDVGSYQRDEFQGHYHRLQVQKTIPQGRGPDNTKAGTERNGFYDNDVRVVEPTSDGSDGTPRYGMETRPGNAYVFYIIKASLKKPAAGKISHP